MKIALIGYGRMGKEIEKIALARGHQIVLIIDLNNLTDFTAENIARAEVAIVFTDPSAAVESFIRCFQSTVPVVSGSTGWLDCWDYVTDTCRQYATAFFYASNFSLGVNLFFELNRYLARIMKPFEQYQPGMTEVHHTRKLDAPSGTAISLAGGLTGECNRIKRWINHSTTNPEELEILSVRKGDVPGIHTIRWDSDEDFIEITHNARSRKGFAMGAILAAEFLHGKKGIFSMKDLINF